MAKFMIAVLTGLFVMGVCSVSFAGVFDDVVNTTEKANTMAKDAKTTADSAEQMADNAKQMVTRSNSPRGRPPRASR